MKKRICSRMFFLLCCTMNAIHQSIQFPPTLGRDSELEFKLEYYRPVQSVDDGTVSSVIIQGNCKVNGRNIQVPEKVSNHQGEKGERVVGFRGSIQFFPNINIDTVRTYLDNAHLDYVNEKEGVYEAYYTLANPLLRDKKILKVSTLQSGMFYQCPMPHEIKVEGHVKTPFVSLESNPVCHGLSDQACQQRKQRIYVHRNNIYPVGDSKDTVTVAPMGEKKLMNTYKHSTVGSSSTQVLSPELLKHCTHGKISAEKTPVMLLDQTTRLPGTEPLAWDVVKAIDGTSHLYTYRHYAQCGDKILRSKPLEWEAERPFIAAPATHHMGFKTAEHEPHRNEEGVAVIPPLFATKFTQNVDKTITMSCVYTDPQHQKSTLVLEASLEVPLERCYLYGKDANNLRDYNATPLKDLYTINKDVTVVSATSKQKEVPVTLHVIP